MPTTERSLLQLNLQDPMTNDKFVYTFDPLKCIIYDADDKAIDTMPVHEAIRGIHVHECKDKQSWDLKTKYNTPTHIRISLGMKCNYRCKYCKQEHTDTIDNYTDEDISKLIDMMSKNLDLSKLKQIQFWGGEPLIYKRTLFNLIDKLRTIIPDTCELFALTNGSLMTPEIADKAYLNDLILGISHDGPGQLFRGGDPLKEGSVSRDGILRYWDLIKKNRENGFTILLTMTKANTTEFNATEKYFVDIFGIEILQRLNFLPLMVDNTDQSDCAMDYSSDSGMAFKIFSFLYHKQMSPSGFTVPLLGFMRYFFKDHFEVDTEQVTCFMASPGVLVFDLYGNILPCQNYNAESVLFDGSTAKMGTLEDLDHVVYPNYISLHKKETQCMSCPVVAMCMGGCPLNKQEYHSKECQLNFTYYMGMLAYLIYLFTGKVLMSIDGEFACKDI